MFFYIDMVDVFWVVIKLDDKKWVCLNCMQYFLYELFYLNKDKYIVKVFDLLIVGRVVIVIECDNYILGKIFYFE